MLVIGGKTWRGRDQRRRRSRICGEEVGAGHLVGRHFWLAVFPRPAWPGAAAGPGAARAPGTAPGPRNRPATAPELLRIPPEQPRFHLRTFLWPGSSRPGPLLPRPGSGAGLGGAGRGCRGAARAMWYIMQSIQSKYSLSERLIRTIAAIRSFPRDNVEDLIGRVRPRGRDIPSLPRPGRPA